MNLKSMSFLTLCVALPAIARAEAYSVHAIFKPGKGATSSNELSQPLSRDGVAALSLSNYNFDRIEVRFSDAAGDKDAFKALAYSDFQIVFHGQGLALQGNQAGPRIITKIVRIKDFSKPQILVKSSELNISSNVVVSLRARHRYSSEFLCGHESGLRKALGKSNVSIPNPPAAIATMLTNLESYLVRPPFLFEGQVPILWSFCLRNKPWDVKWDQIITKLNATDAAVRLAAETLFCPSGCLAAVQAVTSSSGKEEALRKWHKERLVQFMMAHPFEVFVDGDLKHEKIQDGATRENLFLESNTDYFLVPHLTSRLQVQEDSTPIEDDVVDQVSTLHLKYIEPNFPRNMNDLFSRLRVKMLYSDRDDNTETVELKLALNSASSQALDGKLKDYLHKRVIVRVFWVINDQEYLVHESREFSIENLGFIMSAPILSEIYTVYKNVNPADVEATSNIPVSWAWNVSDNTGKQVAITFPWMMSYNPRAAPQLADVFSIYAHASVVLPLNGDVVKKPGVAIGVGARVARSFFFAYGKEVVRDDDPSYLFIGLDIPELAKFINQETNGEASPK
jgi:hypothetical protein